MSRYDGIDYSLIVDSDGNAKKFLHLKFPAKFDDLADYGIYEVEGEDELDYISKKLYGDSDLWYIIAEINQIDFIFDIEVGDRIIFPQSNFLE
ncbi:MAG: hypothetical protein KKD01_19920 [Proteobacteria bacterium]|nr:hypothetical protein [Pseudomonadota bacterium]